MSSAQRIIKYLALAFAIFIIINIASAILFGISSFAGFLGLRKASQEVISENLKEINAPIESANISSLKIDIDYATLTIKTGEKFKIDSNSSSVICKQSNKQLVIKEDGNHWFTHHNDRNIVVTIPEDKMFDAVKIETGAGQVKINALMTKELQFEIGAGHVQIDKLIVKNRAKIDGGAGKVDILSGEIANLDLDMGARKTFNYI